MRRIISMLTAFALGVVAIVLPGIVLSVTRLRDASEAMERNATALSATREIGLRARDYQRLSNMQLITDEPEVADARAENRRELMRALAARAGGRAGNDARATDDRGSMVSRVSEDIERYLTERDRAERERGAPLRVVARTRESFERVLADLRTLEDADTVAVEATFVEARRLAALAVGLAVAGGIVIVIAVLLSARASHRLFSRPLIDLCNAIARFRHGDTAARAVVEGPRELAEVSRTFNGMADTLTAQRADELVFVAGVVHDLRNPLSGIKSGLHALRYEQMAAVRARVLDVIDRQVDRLSHIVGDVIDATKIESGQLELRPEAYDIRRSVREIVGLFAPTSDIHEIVVDAPAGPVIIHADPMRIDQVLGNLISNAIKYAPSGGRIDVRVGTTPSEAVLEVADHGIGIAKEAIPGLFAPFHRLVPETVAGSGLGLSVVRRIVQAHGGSIEVESTLGRGTTFRVRLPRAATPS